MSSSSCFAAPQVYTTYIQNTSRAKLRGLMNSHCVFVCVSVRARRKVLRDSAEEAKSRRPSRRAAVWMRESCVPWFRSRGVVMVEPVCGVQKPDEYCNCNYSCVIVCLQMERNVFREIYLFY